jgi:hypothetical protein
VVLELRAEELAGDVEGLTSHDDDLLTVEQLLGDSAGQTTEEVSFAVDDDLIPNNSSQRQIRYAHLGARVAALKSLGINAPLIRRRTSW